MNRHTNLFLVTIALNKFFTSIYLASARTARKKTFWLD